MPFRHGPGQIHGSDRTVQLALVARLLLNGDPQLFDLGGQQLGPFLFFSARSSYSLRFSFRTA
jgi:hypothetical protein